MYYRHHHRDEKIFKILGIILVLILIYLVLAKIFGFPPFEDPDSGDTPSPAPPGSGSASGSGAGSTLSNVCAPMPPPKTLLSWMYANMHADLRLNGDLGGKIPILNKNVKTPVVLSGKIMSIKNAKCSDSSSSPPCHSGGVVGDNLTLYIDPSTTIAGENVTKTWTDMGPCKNDGKCGWDKKNNLLTLYKEKSSDTYYSNNNGKYFGKIKASGHVVMIEKFQINPDRTITANVRPTSGFAKPEITLTTEGFANACIKSSKSTDGPAPPGGAVTPVAPSVPMPSDSGGGILPPGIKQAAEAGISKVISDAQPVISDIVSHAPAVIDKAESGIHTIKKHLPAVIHATDIGIEAVHSASSAIHKAKGFFHKHHLHI